MATFGGFNDMDLRDKEFYREVFSEPYATIDPLADRGVDVHHSSSRTPAWRTSRERFTSRSASAGWREDREVRDAYVRIARLAREAKKAILSQDWPRLGSLMNENHAIQRRLGGWS